MRELCEKWGIKTHVVPAYSPWVNDLVEGTDKLFLHILKRLCAPDLNNEEAEKMKTEDLPRTWPDHFNDTIRILGLVVNTKPTDVDTLVLPVTEFDGALQMAYVAQQRLDGYAEAVAHAMKRKTAFDKRVLARNPGEVVFSKGHLVQIYRNDLDFTFKTDRKLLPKWSTPQRVTSSHLNSYVLETLDGDPIPGSFSTRRLRRFIPRDGTRLEKEQQLVEERCAREEDERRRKEAEEIAEERRSNTQSPTRLQETQ
jgi:hypothetical protein